MKLFFTTAFFLVFAGELASGTSPTVHPSLSSHFRSNLDANIILSFVGGNTEVIERIQSQSFASKTERITQLKQELEEHASKSQARVKKLLTSENIEFRSFWISNQIHIATATEKLVEILSHFQEITDIRLVAKVFFHRPNELKPGIKLEAEDEPQWNLKIIKADEAWRIANGSGVVAGIIDSGVRATHEAIRDNFRGAAYGWFDPVTLAETPSDWYGHGTHVTGTIAGSKGIGVAPGSTWIHCQGCPSDDNCFQPGFIACAEWVLCPTLPNGTRPDCSKAPGFVSNSWAYGPGETTFMPVTSAWVAAGIVPIFALGNGGPSCMTGGSPGDLKNVIAVGSTTNDDSISSFSSAGPAVSHNDTKPEISAPGSEIRSSFAFADDSYMIMSGTSMATPHLAGVTALLLSANPNLTVAEIRDILLEKGVDTNVKTNGRSCGGVPDNVFPNYIFGYGRVNALKVVLAAHNLTLTSPTV